MRLTKKKKGLAAAGVFTLVLAGCGVSALQQVHNAVNSISASPDIQMVISGTATGSGSAQVNKYLSQFTLHIDAASAKPGVALAQAGKGNVSVDLGLDYHTSPVFDMRMVGTSEYFRFDLTTLQNLFPSIAGGAPGGLGPIMDGQWFQVPPSYLALLTKQASSNPAAQAKVRSGSAAVMSALSQIIENQSTISALSGGGLQAKGSLLSAFNTLAPAIKQITGIAPSSTAITGNYAVTMSISGGTMTGASLSISNKGRAVTVEVAISHLSQPVTTPAQLAKLPQSIVDGLVASQNAVSASAAGFSQG